MYIAPGMIDGGIHREVMSKPLFPYEGGKEVSPVYVHVSGTVVHAVDILDEFPDHIADAEIVFSVVCLEFQDVVFGKAMCDACVEVMECISEVVPFVFLAGIYD